MQRNVWQVLHFAGPLPLVISSLLYVCFLPGFALIGFVTGFLLLFLLFLFKRDWFLVLLVLFFLFYTSWNTVLFLLILFFCCFFVFVLCLSCLFVVVWVGCVYFSFKPIECYQLFSANEYVEFSWWLFPGNSILSLWASPLIQEVFIDMSLKNFSRGKGLYKFLLLISTFIAK